MSMKGRTIYVSGVLWRWRSCGVGGAKHAPLLGVAPTVMCNAALCLPRPRLQPRFAIQVILQLCVAWQGGEKRVLGRCSCGGQGGWRWRKTGMHICTALCLRLWQRQQQLCPPVCVSGSRGREAHTHKLPPTAYLLPLPWPLFHEPSVTLVTGHISHDLVGLVAALIPAPLCLLSPTP